MDLKVLTDLNAREYEHPFDKKALDALQGTKGLDTLVNKLAFLKFTVYCNRARWF
jgi:hypothetical protein